LLSKIYYLYLYAIHKLYSYQHAQLFKIINKYLILLVGKVQKSQVWIHKVGYKNVIYFY